VQLFFFPGLVGIEVLFSFLFGNNVTMTVFLRNLAEALVKPLSQILRVVVVVFLTGFSFCCFSPLLLFLFFSLKLDCYILIKALVAETMLVFKQGFACKI